MKLALNHWILSLDVFKEMVSVWRVEITASVARRDGLPNIHVSGWNTCQVPLNNTLTTCPNYSFCIWIIETRRTSLILKATTTVSPVLGKHQSMYTVEMNFFKAYSLRTCVCIFKDKLTKPFLYLTFELYEIWNEIYL